MRLEDRYLGFVVNFLLGVSWASVLIGAVSSFLSFYEDSFLIATISMFIGIIPGMIAILLLELFITTKEKHSELQKQTRLLEKILTKKEKTDL